MAQINRPDQCRWDTFLADHAFFCASPAQPLDPRPRCLLQRTAVLVAATAVFGPAFAAESVSVQAQ